MTAEETLKRKGGDLVSGQDKNGNELYRKAVFLSDALAAVKQAREEAIGECVSVVEKEMAKLKLPSERLSVYVNIRQVLTSLKERV